LSLLSADALAQPAKVVTFATDPEKQGGLMLEITTEAFKRVGYAVEVKFLPWARAMANAYSGNVDGLLGCFYSSERAEKLLYSDVAAETPVVFFALRKSAIAYAQPSDLHGRTVGLITGATYPKDLIDDPDIRKDFVSDYRLNVQMLLRGRLDAFAEKKVVVLNYLRDAYPRDADAVVALDPPLVVNKLYNAFTRQSPRAEQLRDAFNLGLARLKADGGYAVILAKGLHE
jgi:polar amino acid transport system substrate-binding protein